VTVVTVGVAATTIVPGSGGTTPPASLLLNV
jgi:hypothetical protein